MDPVTAAIGAGGSVLGNVLGSALGSNSSKALQEQAFWNSVKLWNMNNEYNTPLSQKRRLLDAGINPVMAMSGDQGSSTMASPVSTPQVDMSGIGRAGDAIGDFFSRERQMKHEESMAAADTDLKKSQAEGQRIDNTTKAAKAVAEIEDTKERTRSAAAKRALDEQQYNLNNVIQDDVVQRHHLENEALTRDIDLKKVQYDSIVLDNKIKDFHFKHLPEDFSSQLALRAAQIYAQYGQGIQSRAGAKLAQRQADFVVEQMITEDFKRYGIILDNRQKDEILPYLKEKYYWDAGSARNEFYSGEQFGDFWTRQFRSFGNTLSKLSPFNIRFGR